MILHYQTWRWLTHSLALATLLSMSSTALADLELNEEQRAALTDLYNATDGDNWKSNTHWLDGDINACEWHGVLCIELSDGVQVHLALANNGLTGELPESLGDMPGLAGLMVYGNKLSGTLELQAGQYPDLLHIKANNNLFESLVIEPDAAPNLGILEVSNNLLEGAFPEFLEGRDQFNTLDLSHNLFSGELPDWLADLELNRLRLGGNDFTGSIAPAVAALAEELEYNPSGDPDHQLRLDLRANQFSGELDDWLVDYARDFPNWLSLCWNDLTVASEAAASMLAAEHLDGQFEYCLGKSFEPPQITHSGSWFDPQRNGEGISMMLLDNGQTLIHWFTYAASEQPSGQAWFSGNREQTLPAFDMIDLYAPIGGEFAQGLPNPDEYVLAMGARFDVLNVGGDGLNTRQYVNINNNGNHEFASQILDYIQLTELAGTTCDNQSDFQQFSGAWYDPERDGEGFVIEVLPDDRALVYWFTYAPDGSGEQAWVMGDGEFITGGIQIPTPPPGTPVATVIIEDVHLPTGTVFGSAFDPEAVELLPWGRFELGFLSEDEAHIYWESEMADFEGTGDYALQRLARPKLAECD